MNTISEYWSSDQKRHALVKQNESKEYVLECWESGEVKTRTYNNKSIHYVEDAAENYVLGVWNG